MKKRNIIKPDCVFESSWEVCNKVGGIYTVLSSKAKVMSGEPTDSHLYIGPDLGAANDLFFTEEPVALKTWKKDFHKITGLKARTGKWNIPGNPSVILVNFTPLLEGKDQFYGHIWDKFKVDSMNAYGDYDEACAFARAAGMVIEHYYNHSKLQDKKVVAHFHEWTMGMGLLYIKDKQPDIKTVFTTHATTTGRSIAGNNKELYRYFNGYNGDIMAAELGVPAKHSLEKQAAHNSDCFTTVSHITAKECKQLLCKAPDVVTPNGFEGELVPKGTAYTAKRKAARTKLRAIATALTGRQPADDALLVSISGRYEYRNKGIDLFIKSLEQLRDNADSLTKEVVAFILIPGDVKEPRADLTERLGKKKKATEALPLPFTTHWLNYPHNDKILNYINLLGFTNQPDEKVKVILIPSYLNGSDGIVNFDYYDLLTGMDITVYPSYYEPWGYTPHESIAFGIPTITSEWSGFGAWVEKDSKVKGWKQGVEIVYRQEDNYFEAAQIIAAKIAEAGNATPDEIKEVRKNAQKLAGKADWEHFIQFYFEAYDIALSKKLSKQKSNKK